MVNPPELPINDEARNEAHIASTGVQLYSAENETENFVVMHHEIS